MCLEFQKGVEAANLQRLSQQAGKKRAGAAVHCPQSVFLGPLEPVILWTRAQEEGRSRKILCLACGLSSLEKKVKLSLLTLLMLKQSGRIHTSVPTCVSKWKWFLPQLLIWGHPPKLGGLSVAKSVVLAGIVEGVFLWNRAENCLPSLCRLPSDLSLFLGSCVS